MPGLLSIQRCLLLALLALLPALALAQARQQVWNPANWTGWSIRINDAPAGTVNLFDVHKNPNEVGTGLKFSHLSHCSGNRGVRYVLYDRTAGSLDRNYFNFMNSDATSDFFSNAFHPG